MDDLFYAQVIIFVGNIISGLFLAYLSRNMYLASKELWMLGFDLNDSLNRMEKLSGASGEITKPSEDA